MKTKFVFILHYLKAIFRSSVTKQKKDTSSSGSIRQLPVKVEEHFLCPRCEKEQLELICDNEIFFCFHCGYSFNIKKFMKTRLQIIQEGFKGWSVSCMEAIRILEETFNRAGKIVADFERAIRILSEEKEKKEKKNG